MTVVLRPWRTTDAAALVDAVRQTPDLVVQLGGAEPSTIADAADCIRRTLVSGDDAQHWAVVEDGVAIGDVGLSAIEHRHDTAWVSYWLAAPGRGRGLATLGLLAVAQRAFADGLHRLELGHRVGNPASCRVATRCGFAAEGIEREKLRYGSVRHDVETHARLATDPAPSTDRALHTVT